MKRLHVYPFKTIPLNKYVRDAYYLNLTLEIVTLSAFLEIQLTVVSSIPTVEIG